MRYLHILNILIALLPAFSSWGEVRYASKIDSIQLTLGHAELERAYDAFIAEKTNSKEEAISQAIIAINVATRLGKYDEVNRFIKLIPDRSMGTVRFERSILLALADYKRFNNLGFEIGDNRFLINKFTKNLSAEAINSKEHDYMFGHYVRIIKDYVSCEEALAPIAMEFMEKYDKGPVSQYEVEAYLYWIENLIDNSKYEQATEELEKLPKILTPSISGNPYYLGWALYLDGKLQQILGNSKAAEESLSMAAEILEDENETVNLIYPVITRELGLAQMSANTPEKAIGSFKKYRESMAKIFGKESVAEWDACNYCLDALFEAKQLDEFGKLFNEVETFKSYSNMEGTFGFFQISHTYKAGALYHLHNNLYASSVAQIFEFLVNGYKDVDVQDVLELRSLLNYAGYSQILAENPAAALKHFSNQLEIDRKYAREVFSFLPENLRSAYWGKNRAVMNRFFTLNRTGSLTLEGGKVTALTTEPADDETGELLYDGSLLNKGIMLQAVVSLQRILARSGNEHLMKLNDELTKIRHIQSAKPLTTEQANHAEYIERQLIKGSKQYGDFMNFANIRWQDIRNSLKDNEVAIEFVSSTDEGVEYYSAEILRKDFSRPKHIFLFGCKEGENIFNREDIYNSNFLNLKVWKRILKYVNPGETIYFSPAGILYGVAIENAKCGPEERISTLYNPVRLSSTREITLNDTESSKGEIVLYGGLDYDMNTEDMQMMAEASGFRGAGNGDSNIQRIAWNYLPGTYDEVQTITSYLKQGKKGNVSVYSGIEGTEENFKNISKKSINTLHIATHGFALKDTNATNSSLNSDYITADNSMSNCGLLLSGGNNGWLFPELIPEGVEDGILTAKEIASLDFSDTDLVILSACQTGLGQTSGEGVYGLQRAFKLAGANTIVMSLAEVHDDATRLLMTQFHRHLQNGLTKRSAFAKAQEAVKEASFNIDGEVIPGSDPRFWAPFVILD